MADDLFGMLYNSLDVHKQLLTAVSCDMMDSVHQLLKNKTLDVNSPLMMQNGNRALHICAQKGSYHCMEVLLRHCADPDVFNHFGLSPLAMTLRNGHEKCARLLLNTGCVNSAPHLVWKSTQMNELYTWISYSPETIRVLLIATPDLCQLGEDIVHKLYSTFLHSVQSPALVKTFFLAGNGLSQAEMNQLITQVEQTPNVELAEWLKSYKKGVHSLQHLSRTAIRKTLHPNVFFAAQLLPIPLPLQAYITLCDLSF